MEEDVKSRVQASAIRNQGRVLERKDSSETTDEEREAISDGIIFKLYDEAGNSCPHENTRRAPEFDVPGVATYVCEDCGVSNFVDIYDDFL